MAFGHAQDTKTNEDPTLDIFTDVTSFENLLRSSAILIEIVLGDVLLVCSHEYHSQSVVEKKIQLYRCYVAWGSKIPVLIIPSLFVVGTAGKSLGTMPFYNFGIILIFIK